MCWKYYYFVCNNYIHHLHQILQIERGKAPCMAPQNPEPCFEKKNPSRMNEINQSPILMYPLFFIKPVIPP